jgi:GNAT superfamily N-acetyltransferase
MNEFLDGNVPGDTPVDPHQLPEVPIGNETATEAEPITHPFDADTSGIGGYADVDSGDDEAVEARDIPAETEPDEQERYRQTHAAIRHAVEVNTGQDLLPAGYASDVRYSRTVEEAQLPDAPRELLAAVPTSERATAVTYTEEQRATGLIEDYPRVMSPKDTLRHAEVVFQRSETIPDEPDRNVTVSYELREHNLARSPAAPLAEPTYTAERRVLIESDAFSPGDASRTLDLSAYANRELGDRVISSAEAEALADHVEATAVPPEVNETNPATITDMGELHEAVVQATGDAEYTDPGRGLRGRYDHSVAAETVPDTVHAALDEVAEMAEGTPARYRMRTRIEDGPNGQQTAQVRYFRSELDADEPDAAVLRETTVQYDSQYTPPDPTSDRSVPEYTLARTGGVSFGGHTDSRTTSARGGYGYGRIPGQHTGVISRAEALGVAGHVAEALGSEAPSGTTEAADVTAITDVPSRGHELAGEPVSGSWLRYPGEGVTVNATVGDNETSIYANGTFTDDEVPNGFRFGTMRVHEDYRQAGLATRMVQALAATAIAGGAETMYGFAESPHSVRILASLANDAAIIYSGTSPEGERLSLGSTAEAVAYLESMTPREADLEHREIGIGIEIRVADIDQDQLGEPVALAEPLPANPWEIRPVDG